MTDYVYNSVRFNPGEWFPAVNPGWTMVAYCDEATAIVGDADDNFADEFHGGVYGDDFISAPARVLRDAGIPCEWDYRATHSADVLGWLCVRDEDAPRALAALRECVTDDGAACIGDMDKMLRRLRAINDTARAAIRKATGEAK